MRTETIGDSPPIRRPYPREAILAAKGLLRALGHTQSTIDGAEAVNSPLWQRAIWAHLTHAQRLLAATA